MNQHVVHPLYRQAERALRLCGGLYNMQDLVEGIHEGRFQSFVLGESWAVTQISHFPRKDILDVIFVAGRRKDLVELEKQLIEFAKSYELELMMASGRMGWLRRTLFGWKPAFVTFFKEI